ncbi:MAG TPA: hypothetical protein VLA75_03040 [Thermoanaerobaculia bacterium]|nr:hypothetical protein [Thermoanaerobaculia bacterium]
MSDTKPLPTGRVTGPYSRCAPVPPVGVGVAAPPFRGGGLAMTDDLLVEESR